jgi:hypothetical protein
MGPAVRKAAAQHRGCPMQKLFVCVAALGLASGTFANHASAEIIKTDAGPACQKFCWSQGFDQETYGRDHTTFITSVRPRGNGINSYLKGLMDD